MQAKQIDAAISRFKHANSADPNRVTVDGEVRPKELVDAERLAAWVLRLEPNPSEALLLAAYCQHLRRWEIPRGTFPEGRVGYLKWRKELSKFHAEAAADVLRDVGVDAGTIDAVRRINLKQGLTTNRDTQTIEDALCLAFLEFEAADFALKHERAKVVAILRKTWRKMSPRAKSAALELDMPAPLAQLVEVALARPDPSESDADESG